VAGVGPWVVPGRVVTHSCPLPRVLFLLAIPIGIRTYPRFSCHLAGQLRAGGGSAAPGSAPKRVTCQVFVHFGNYAYFAVKLAVAALDALPGRRV
jgi:hypothetical protein